MALKAVFIGAFAFMILVQSIAGKSCYRPLPQPSCSCGGRSGSVTIIENEPAVVSRRNSRPVSISTPAPCVSIDIPQNGGPLAITSIGPITPTGIALATELGLAGSLDVYGAVPYLSAVSFEGQFPTDTITPVSYGCGDVITINEQIGGSASLSGLGYASNVGCGCGC